MKIHCQRAFFCVWILALLFPIFVYSQDAGKDVDFIWGVKIPMRDGVRLNATVYKPEKMDAPLPVIFTLTPYISDSYHPRAYYFSQNGYVFVLVDCRGRGNSEGEFEPFANEGKDGHDIVEWLAKQSWSNGKVTMWGGSYAGFDQWSTLKEFPPHLVTIVPAAAAAAAVDFPFSGNRFYSYDIQWLTYTSGRTPNGNLFGESSFWIEKYREMYLQHLPFKDLDKIVGNESTVFQKWLQHPIPDAYWDAMNPDVAAYQKMNLPILTITGHYDGDQAGAMHYYKMQMKEGNAEGKSKHYLIIGPWDHAGTRTPNADVGGLHFGSASMLDMNQLHKDWYDWTLKNGMKPEFLKKQVAYYVVGSEEWKYSDSLEEISNSKLRMYLNSENGYANDAMRSGVLLGSKPGGSKPDQFVYDPLDTRPASLETEEIQNYLTDQRVPLNLFGNGLVYHSEPFSSDTEISGYLKLSAWMSMDVPDTDFQVTVYEIKQDGTSILLTEQGMRARYRGSLRQEKLVKSGEINEYVFDDFAFFSRKIAAGSRLRLLIRCPNTIFFEKNYNSGGKVSEETGKDAKTAHVTLYHDPEHSSYLELPVVK
jgi:putative CocE/NonD family hydrolase